MLTMDDVVTLSFCSEELEAAGVFANARKATIGGKSLIFGEGRSQAEVVQSNLTGQICEYACSLYLTGSSESYQMSRRRANANPHSSDYGKDIPGHSIDIKGTRMQPNHRNPLLYNLIVRHKDWKPNWEYILALLQGEFTVYIIGYIHSGKMPPASEGRFGYSHVMPACKLWSLKEAKGCLSNWKA
jgi:hypothetical protein